MLRERSADTERPGRSCHNTACSPERPFGSRTLVFIAILGGIPDTRGARLRASEPGLRSVLPELVALLQKSEP